MHLTIDQVYRRLAVAVLIGLIGWFDPSQVAAKETQSYIADAEQYFAKGNLKAAEIELRNAVRQAPQDPFIRSRLADVYLRLGDARAAEREARAARDRGGEEAAFVPVLTESLLRQDKFSELLALISPGDRAPMLESKVRLALGLAQLGQRDPDKAEALMREAIKLDQSAPTPKLALAKLLGTRDPAASNKFVDEVLAATPRSAEALQLKGELLRAQGDATAAMQRFNEAISITPNNREVRLVRADLHIAEGNLKSAEEDLAFVLKGTPDNIQANYLRALTFVRRGEYRAADEILTKINTAFSSLRSGYYLQAFTKFNLKEYAHAEANFEKHIARFPNDASAVRLMARAALSQGAASRAIEYVKPLAERSSADAETVILLGNAYLADRKPALALQQFERAATLAPTSPEMKTQMSLLQLVTGQQQKGLAQLEQLFATDEGAAAAGSALVLSELQAGRLGKAAEVADALIKRDAKNPVYQVLLAMVRTTQGDYPAAEATYRAIIAQDPGFVPAIRNLAQLYRNLERSEEAKKLYLDLLSRQPNEVTALLGLADLAIAQKKWPEGVDYINRARTVAPKDPASGLKLVNLYSLRQDWSNAKATATLLASEFPGNLDVLDAQGRVFISAGEMESATDTYRRAHQLEPSSMQILGRYASLLEAAKDFSRLQIVLAAALARDPRSAFLKENLIRVEAQLNGLDAALVKARAFAKEDAGNSQYDRVMANVYEKAGRRPEAVAVLERAAAAQPADDAIAIALSGLYIRAGDIPKAEALLNDRLNADPTKLGVRMALAAALLDNKKFDAALTEYTRLLATNDSDPIVLNNLAWLYQRQGDLAKAFELAERAVAAAPGVATMQDTLGWIVLAQGDTDKALSYLIAANASTPTNPDIQYHLAVALHRAGKTSDARTLLESLLSSNISFADKAQAEQLLEQIKRG